MTKLEQLMTFIHVAEQNSFSRAAKKLNVTPSAISQKISALESNIELTLIKRSNQGIQLTEPGTSIYHGCLKILKEYQEVEGLIAETKNLAVGTLHIACPLGYSILKHLDLFQKKYPNITVHVDCSEQISVFQHTESIDLVFGAPRTTQSCFSLETVQRKIIETQLVYCASPGYLQKTGYPMSPVHVLQDLHSHRFIIHTSDADLTHWLEFASGQKYEITPSLKLNQNNMIIQAALSDLGIIKIPEYLVRPYLAAKTLEIIWPEDPAPKIDLMLFYPYTKHIKPALRCFIDFMIQSIQEQGL